LTVFLDTSAILAVLNGDDECHSEADAIWRRLLQTEEPLLSSNYVLVETFALVQRRLGMDAVRAVEHEIVPLLDLHWLDAEMHHASITTWLAVSRRSLSLVDCASFEVMRSRGVQRAFAFDGHFEEYGFDLLHD
jgi:predicted nucleic acid-binding protein